MGSNYMMLTSQFVLKISSIHSLVVLSALLMALSLSHHITVFANHGQEISLTLNSAKFLPLSSAEGNQLNLVVNYSGVESKILGQTINAVMKACVPNTTAIKST
jgi:hypothetical protein